MLETVLKSKPFLRRVRYSTEPDSVRLFSFSFRAGSVSVAPYMSFFIFDSGELEISLNVIEIATDLSGDITGSRAEDTLLLSHIVEMKK